MKTKKTSTNDSPDRPRHKKTKDVPGGKMLMGVSKTKPGATGAARTTTSKRIKHRKVMY